MINQTYVRQQVKKEEKKELEVEHKYINLNNCKTEKVT